MLSDERIDDIYKSHMSRRTFARAIEAEVLQAQEPKEGYALVPEELNEVTRTTMKNFIDGMHYLHHPRVPYLGTVNGDTEEAWLERIRAQLYKEIIQAAKEVPNADISTD